MPFRELFNTSEWQTLTFAPLWAFSSIAAADGNIDTSETGVLMTQIAEAPLLKAPFSREVFLAIAADLPTLLPAYKADTRNAYAGLRDVVTLLQRVDAKEAAMFKFAVMAVGSKVAVATGKPGDPIATEEAQAWAMTGAMLGFDQKEAEAAFKSL